ncbi:hypothetical protein [Clostridium sulfidigenes]|uniref:hypothetical protein n=1 Tax=Clostridium sulfidigenes TaxID=318464 RepID=UPI003F89DDB9
MEIIKLPSVVEKERKHMRSANLKKNKNAYSKLKSMMVPQELKLAQFRKYYHSVLSTAEKEIVIKMGLDPWSVEGIKYVGDCKRYKTKLGDPILDNIKQDNVIK